MLAWRRVPLLVVAFIALPAIVRAAGDDRPNAFFVEPELMLAARSGVSEWNAPAALPLSQNSMPDPAQNVHNPWTTERLAARPNSPYAVQTTAFESGPSLTGPVLPEPEWGAMPPEGYSDAVTREAHPAWQRFGHSIADDFYNFYNWRGLLWIAGGIGVNGVIANTSLDQDFHDWYQRDVRTAASDDFSKIWEKGGHGEWLVPAYAALTLWEMWYEKRNQDTCWLGLWGENCFRSTLVGAPAALLLQVTLGASRPVEPNGSDWHPFQDSNGVSGHAFIGAVPFINAAKMTDNWALKSSFYGLSTLTAWSRVNDDRHYVSQAILGWWLAYLAAEAVQTTNEESTRFVVTPVAMSGGVGIQATLTW